MKIMLTAAIAVAAVTGANASTMTASGVPTAKVFYGDLDLESAAGMKTLQSRIALAARTVCGNSVGIADIAVLQADKQCRSKAAAHAAQRFAARSGRQLASR